MELLAYTLMAFLITALPVFGWSSFGFVFSLLLLLTWQAKDYLTETPSRPGDGVAMGILVGGILFFLITAWAGLFARGISLFARQFDQFRPRSLWIEATIFLLWVVAMRIWGPDILIAISSNL